jgi:hypothetical protein
MGTALAWRRMCRGRSVEQSARFGRSRFLRFKQAFQFGNRKQILLPPGGAFRCNQTPEIQCAHLAAECVHAQRYRLNFLERAQPAHLSQQIDAPQLRGEGKDCTVAQSSFVPNERQAFGQVRGAWMVRRQSFNQVAQVLWSPREEDIEVAGDAAAAVQDRRPATDDNELNASIAKRLYRSVEIHLRRAAPRTLSAVCARSCNRRTRSPGSRRNCSISSVISTPNFFAASMRPPGAGFRSLDAARVSSSDVKARSSFTTKVYRQPGLGRHATRQIGCMSIFFPGSISSHVNIPISTIRLPK